MTERQHLPCPDTQGCGSSDAWGYNTETNLGYCFACELKTWVYKGQLMGKRGKRGEQMELSQATKEAHTAAVEDFGEYVPKNITDTTQGGSYVPLRGITAATMEKFGVKTFKDVPYKIYDKHTYKVIEDGVSDEVQAVYPSGKFKGRRLNLPKEHDGHFYTPKGFKTDEMFGMNLFPVNSSKIVTITEGELDAMSAWQMLSQGSTYTNPVVSLPSSTPSGKLWENCKGWLDSFDKIILSVDNDEAGRRVAETMFDLFPAKVYMMDHGQYKDANDFLQAGDQKAYKSAWWGAKKYSPAGFTASIDDWMDAIDGEDPYEYTPTPIDAYNKIGKGLVKGGITVVKAPPGTGKSSYLRKLMHDLVVDKKKVVAALMMEEVKSVTGRAMATYQLGVNVKTKEDASFNGVTEDQVKEALVTVLGEERFISFDVNPQDPVEDTLKQCKYAISVYGAEYIFIDHLQRLAYLMGTDTATSSLTELGVKLTELAKRRNVGIVCISHVNSEGKTKYAGSIEEEAIVMIEMSRDKKADDLQERNTTYLEITKNRPYALTGPAGMLTYDVETDMVTERLGPREPVSKGETNDF